MRITIFLCFLLSGIEFFAQVSTDVEQKRLPPPMIEKDSLYREDQFYCGFTFNVLFDTPEGLTQNKFSVGFTGGFIRDMPINKTRTKAIGLGLGVTYNKFFQNLLIYNTPSETKYNIIDPGVQYQKNKLDEILIDVPLEYRWRTSTPESHKFWRVYSGFKFSYAVASKSIYIDATSNIKVTDNKDINRFQVGAYIVGGYNTWNIYGYYGITPLFKSSAEVNGQPIGLHAVNVGLIFYILEPTVPKCGLRNQSQHKPD